jgi:hypothetical protein
MIPLILLPPGARPLRGCWRAFAALSSWNGTGTASHVTAAIHVVAIAGYWLCV